MKQATYEEAYRLQAKISTLTSKISKLTNFTTQVGTTSQLINFDQQEVSLHPIAITQALNTQIKEYESELITLKREFNEL